MTRRRYQRPATQVQSRQADVIVIVLTLIMAGIPFLLGKYFELNSPDPFDSAIYAYSAKHILEGARIGVDEIPSAQIGTLLVNILGVWLFGFSETGPKLIQGLLQLVAFVMMFVAVRRHFGRAAASVAVIVASLCLSSPMVAKYGNVKEQHMIAFMVIGVSSLLLYYASERWWQAFLAGATLSWAPLFKQTGVSALVAAGLFVIWQPVVGRRSIKQAVVDVCLLLAGAVAAIGPLFVWILGWDVKLPLPYDWVGFAFSKFLASGSTADPNAISADYVTSARKLVTIGQQAAMVFRYYMVLILPVAMGATSIVIRLTRLVAKRFGRASEMWPWERFVLLLGIWWLLDM
ncbi:MAG: glycosyltransferase family 39 protein, partial [Sedimentisphaerales bacterium]|nr:glycosyltransferase family 39 protein [Sedimentisphaerales bacterium]